MILKKETSYTLQQLIDIIIENEYALEAYTVFFDPKAKDNFTRNMICYVDEDDIDDIEGDGYSEFVIKNKLKELYMGLGQQFAEVITCAVEWKKYAFDNDQCNSPNVTMDEFIKALEYYNDNDAFMSFNLESGKIE